ncbi:lipoprotein [Salmonella enterica subsp. enterica]|uniref:Lipoprotein n=1 Tax=Salmonella enterica I TaxID=59201 RepID=A0A3S4I044_SALET|nr:lipoprotein [Salmonella enterica subsp. enterica]
MISFCYYFLCIIAKTKGIVSCVLILYLKLQCLLALLALSGCASKVTQPDKYSGFLKNYSDLQETTSATGKPVLRWVDPHFNDSNYDSIVYNPITYYPVPKPTTQVGQQVS